MNRPVVKISDKHFTFTTTNDVKDACRELFAKSPLSVFYHGVFTKDGKASIVTTIPEYNQFVFANGIIPEFGGPELSHGIHYLPTSEGSYQRSENGKRFNIDNVIEFAEESSDRVEIIGFGTSCGFRSMTNYYFNHLAELRQFALEFKNNAKVLINKAFKEPLIIATSDSDYINSNVVQQPLCLKKLTSREKDVLLAFYRGLSAKQTAQLFNISPRTVEYYLDCVKQKFRVRRKAELIKYMLMHQNFN